MSQILQGQPCGTFSSFFHDFFVRTLQAVLSNKIIEVQTVFQGENLISAFILFCVFYVCGLCRSRSFSPLTNKLIICHLKHTFCCFNTAQPDDSAAAVKNKRLSKWLFLGQIMIWFLFNQHIPADFLFLLLVLDFLLVHLLGDFSIIFS